MTDPLLQWLSTTPYAWVIPWLFLASVVCSILDSLLPQPKEGSHALPFRKLMTFCAFRFANGAVQQPPLVTWFARVLLPIITNPAVQQAIAAKVNQIQAAKPVVRQEPTPLVNPTGAKP